MSTMSLIDDPFPALGVTILQAGGSIVVRSFLPLVAQAQIPLSDSP